MGLADLQAQLIAGLLGLAWRDAAIGSNLERGLNFDQSLPEAIDLRFPFDGPRGLCCKLLVFVFQHLRLEGQPVLELVDLGAQILRAGRFVRRALDGLGVSVDPGIARRVLL